MMYKKFKTGIRRLLSRVWHFTESARVLALKLIFRKGILRKIGDIANIYISPECRELAVVPQAHEIKLWKRLIEEVRPGDTIIDVGAYIGALTIILAKKTGVGGRVLAFEPHPKSSLLLRRNVRLNGVWGQVEFFDTAIGEDNGERLLADDGTKSQIISSANSGYANFFTVKCASLDEALEGIKVDILKIDTEGYEANVIRGAKALLSRKYGCPRFISIECHPHKWAEYGVNSRDIILMLEDAGYTVEVPETPGNVELDNFIGNWAIFAENRLGR